MLACAQLQHITTDSLEGIKDWSDFSHVWQQLQDLPPFTLLSLVGVHEPRIHPVDSVQVCVHIPITMAGIVSSPKP